MLYLFDGQKQKKRGLCMKIMKKAVSVILSATICITLFTGASAAAASNDTLAAATFALTDSTTNTTTDLNKMAAALNKLNILQGENGNYKLGSQVKRSEATALIIRTLGKENYVKQNANLFKSTKFTDVPQNQWYAPYIGYGTQNNILSGKTLNTFVPDEFTTEKQFLKMALCALGYIENTDFDWSNIYQKAYSIGIVTDPSYASKTQDNTAYLRSEAVKVIYRSLNTPKKGSQKKLANVLVDEGAFTSATIAASGIFGDDLPTSIEKVTSTAPDSIEVDLNDNIQSVIMADVTIYDTALTSSVLAVKSLAFKDDKLQIITAGQISGRSYTININSVTDINGNISGKLTGSFTGYTQQQVSSDFFRIKKVEQASANVINVYFTHPVNNNSENPAYFEITRNGSTYLAGSTQNFSVKRLQLADNAVSILLKNATLTQGEVYGVKVSGKLSSSYGAKLGDGAGGSMDFVTTAAQTAQLEVASVQAWTSTSVRVIFNREVDPNWAGKRLNYTVYDGNKNEIEVTKAALSDDGREVMLTLAASLDKTKQYEVQMEMIPDIYGQNPIEGKSYKFSGLYPDNISLALSQASSGYSNSVTLTFNKSVDAASASDATNYYIQGVSDSTFYATPVKAYFNAQGGQNTVKLFLPAERAFKNGERYLVYVSSLKDATGSTSYDSIKAEFYGSGNSVVKPQITDAVTVARDTVKLSFNVEIAYDLNNISQNNYSLEYVENGETIKMIPIGVNYTDAKTLVLKFDELDQTKSYQIKFNTITDYSGLYPRTIADGGNSYAVRWGK